MDAVSEANRPDSFGLAWTSGVRFSIEPFEGSRFARGGRYWDFNGGNPGDRRDVDFNLLKSFG